MFSVTSILRVTAKDMYHYIVSIIAISLFVSISLIPFVLFLPWQLAIVYMLVVGGPVFFGASVCVESMLTNKKSPLILEFLKGVKRHYFQGVGIACVFGAFVLILIASWWHWSVEGTWFAFAIACFQTYFAGMIALSQLYTVPLIIKHQLTLPKAMITSVKLLLANPLYTMGCFIQLALFAALLTVTIVGNALLLPGIAALFFNRMTSGVVSRSELIMEGRTDNALQKSAHI
ncbi:hypothetical protein [Shouchella patagoniensis]|uniref:hypothetical protein n=1 Tax=Shouchella patagoniensis TaxID=228576 RepID=UPI000995101E|nr:hypothetical protein [Shouchella patagoniensis]